MIISLVGVILVLHGISYCITSKIIGIIEFNLAMLTVLGLLGAGAQSFSAGSVTS